MAFADGVSLSSARRSLRCLLFSSSSRPHATAAGWNHPLLLLLLLHRVAGHEDGAHGGGVPRARVHVGGGVGHVRACGRRGEGVGGLAGEAASGEEGEEEKEEEGEGEPGGRGGRLVCPRDAVRRRGVGELRRGAPADGGERKAGWCGIFIAGKDIIGLPVGLRR
ncbi:hypothetical protein BHM03_00034018 [Ensete ventricosum]|nr:hypothetical protein BHM03_00034018 [Ensete ventricosum]